MASDKDAKAAPVIDLAAELPGIKSKAQALHTRRQIMRTMSSCVIDLQKDLPGALEDLLALEKKARLVRCSNSSECF
jgi:hypothetical protein